MVTVVVDGAVTGSYRYTTLKDVTMDGWSICAASPWGSET